MAVNLIVAYVHAYVGHGRNAGAETTLHDLLKFMVKNGWEADVIVTSLQGPGFVVDGVRVHSGQDRRTILHFIPKASVVISHLECTDRAVILGRKFRTPVVQLIHNDMDLTKGYAAMGADLIIFNTRWVSDSFNYNGLSCVVHPPISREDYSILDKTCSQDYVTMVNMWKNKGSDIFYDVANLLPDVKFLAVPGGYGEQDLRDGYSNVTIAAHEMDMANIYCRSRIVLMPSRYESYGRVAVEAASCGIPSVVCPTQGLKEALGQAGCYAETAEQFAREVKRLQHWKAYKSASVKVSSRFNEIEQETAVELDRALFYLNGIADTARLLRGW